MNKPATPQVLRLAALILTLLGLAAGCSTFDAQQRRWIFQASPSVPDAGRAADLPNHSTPGMEDVWIPHVSPSSGRTIRLHGLWHPNADPWAPVLLYLHGARRNVEASAFRIRRMNSLGFSVLAIDYRGFGRSTDELPSEAAVYEDARAAWRWLGEHEPGKDRYVFGHSLGGAVAIQLASEATDVSGLIVEGTFTSIRDLFQTMRWGWLPVSALITQRFDSAAKIGKVRAPVLIVHGTDDALVPAQLASNLYDKVRSPKRLVLVEGGSHYSTNAVGAAQYQSALGELFGIGVGNSSGESIASFQ